MKINPVVSRLASASVYLFAIGVAIYALFAPYMKAENDNTVLDIYMDKACVDNKCEKDKFFDMESNALYALYITFIILAGLCFILLLTNQCKLYSWIGLLLLALSIGAMIYLILVIKYSSIEIWWVEVNFDFTSSSILMIIAFCFMIIKQFYSNEIIRGLLRKIIH